MTTTDAISSYPWFLNKPLELLINDQPIQTRVSGAEWATYWRPFLARMVEVVKRFSPRLTIAIVGPPGSGKSVFAEQLNWIAFKGFLPGATSVALQMDGFHYSPAHLAMHFRKLPDGTEEPLSKYKGAPDTIDAKTIRQRLEHIRNMQDTVWPGYSRLAHTTVPDAYHVRKGHNMVIVEGNYLLLDKGPFQGIKDFFDLKIYLDVPPMSIVAALMARHTAGGKSMDEAKEAVKQNDIINARLVESTKSLADVIIERHGDNNEITAIRWLRDPTPKSPTLA